MRMLGVPVRVVSSDRCSISACTLDRLYHSDWYLLTSLAAYNIYIGCTGGSVSLPSSVMEKVHVHVYFYVDKQQAWPPTGPTW